MSIQSEIYLAILDEHLIVRVCRIHLAGGGGWSNCPRSSRLRHGNHISSEREEKSNDLYKPIAYYNIPSISNNNKLDY